MVAVLVRGSNRLNTHDLLGPLYVQQLVHQQFSHHPIRQSREDISYFAVLCAMYTEQL